MNGKNINFNCERNQQKRLLQTKNKKTFNVDDIDVNEILISKKETFGKYNSVKYLIGYNDIVIRPLYLFFYKQLAILINLIKIK